MTTEISFEFMSELDQLKDIASKAVNMGNDLGTTQVEVTVRNGFNRSLEIKNNKPSGIQQQSTNGISIRAYIGKKLGIASSSSLSKHSVEDTVKAAVELAKLSPADEHFHSLPEIMNRSPQQVNGLFDKRLASFDPEDFISYADDMIQGARSKHDNLIAGGQMRINTSEMVVANSLGIEVGNQTTNFNCYNMSSIPLSPTNVGVGFEFFAARNLNEKIDTTRVGEISGEKAIKMLNAQSGPSGNFSILIDQRATNRSLRSLVGMGVNGFSVMMKTSYFADKIGEDVAIKGLSMVDNPHVEGGFGSRIHDVEGVPTTKVELIKDGVLTSYITDSYTAHRLGLENTGSASRGMGGNLPRPGISQVHIDAGSDSLTAMLEDMREGIYMESGVGGMFNRGSPNISNKIDRGFYVKNGEIQYPIKNSMLGTNVFEFLINIKGISKELLIEFGSQSPAILVDNISIGGAKDKKKGPAPVGMSSF